MPEADVGTVAALVVALVAITQVLVEVLRKFVFKTYGTHDSESHAVIIAEMRRLTVGCTAIKGEVGKLCEAENERQKYLIGVTTHMNETERINHVVVQAVSDLRNEWGRGSERAARMVQQVNELHGWHDHDDPDEPGVKIWWTRRSLEKAIRENTESMRDLSAMLKSRIPKNGSSG